MRLNHKQERGVWLLCVIALCAGCKDKKRGMPAASPRTFDHPALCIVSKGMPDSVPTFRVPRGQTPVPCICPTPPSLTHVYGGVSGVCGREPSDLATRQDTRHQLAESWWVSRGRSRDCGSPTCDTLFFGPYRGEASQVTGRAHGLGRRAVRQKAVAREMRADAGSPALSVWRAQGFTNEGWRSGCLYREVGAIREGYVSSVHGKLRVRRG